MVVGSLRKNWWRRVWWWILGAVLIVWLSFKYPPLIPLAVVVFVLIDEWLKEGYFFKKSDVNKAGTHENIVVLTTVISVMIEYLRYRRKGRDRGG